MKRAKIKEFSNYPDNTLAQMNNSEKKEIHYESQQMKIGY